MTFDEKFYKLWSAVQSRLTKLQQNFTVLKDQLRPPFKTVIDIEDISKETDQNKKTALLFLLAVVERHCSVLSEALKLNNINFLSEMVKNKFFEVYPFRYLFRETHILNILYSYHPDPIENLAELKEAAETYEKNVSCYKGHTAPAILTGFGTGAMIAIMVTAGVILGGGSAACVALLVMLAPMAVGLLLATIYNAYKAHVFPKQALKYVSLVNDVGPVITNTNANANSLSKKFETAFNDFGFNYITIRARQGCPVVVAGDRERIKVKFYGVNTDISFNHVPNHVPTNSAAAAGAGAEVATTTPLQQPQTPVAANSAMSALASAASPNSATSSGGIPIPTSSRKTREELLSGLASPDAIPFPISPLRRSNSMPNFQQQPGLAPVVSPARG